MKKITTGFLALAATLGALNALAQEPVEIRLMWNTDAVQTRFWERLIADFEQKNPDIRIRKDFYSNETYKTAFKIVATSENPADIMFNWAGSRPNILADDGLLYDMSKLDINLDNISPALLEPFNHKGVQIGIPNTIYNKAFWKNDDLFAEAGLTEPETFDELLSSCKVIREKLPGITPIALGASESWTINHYLSQFVFMEVPEEQLLLDVALEGDTPNYTHPGYKKALTHMTAMQDAGCFNEGINSLSPEAARAMFSAEISAMTYCGNWCIPEFISGGLQNFSAFPMPPVDPEKADDNPLFVGTQGYTVHARTKYPEQVTRFINYMLDGPAQAEFAYHYGELPVNITGIDPEKMDKPTTSILEMVQQANRLSAPMDTLMDPRTDRQFLNLGQELINKTVTEAEFMEQIQKQVVNQKKG